VYLIALSRGEPLELKVQPQRRHFGYLSGEAAVSEEGKPVLQSAEQSQVCLRSGIGGLCLDASLFPCSDERPETPGTTNLPCSPHSHPFRLTWKQLQQRLNPRANDGS
jgi:hypothetical protein